MNALFDALCPRMTVERVSEIHSKIGFMDTSSYRLRVCKVLMEALIQAPLEATVPIRARRNSVRYSRSVCRRGSGDANSGTGESSAMIISRPNGGAIVNAARIHRIAHR